MLDAEEILGEAARIDLSSVEDYGRLPCELLSALSPARQRNVLRFAIRALNLPLPGSRQLAEIRRAIHVSRPDAETCVSWPGGEARIYRDHLFLQAPMSRILEISAPDGLRPDIRWSSAIGELALEPASGIGLPDQWVREGLKIRFRRGGERFRPLNRGHSRPLKKWLQEAGIVPWMRPWIPLIMRNESIVAVGDLWLADSVREIPAGKCWQVVWRGHPRLR